MPELSPHRGSCKSEGRYGKRERNSGQRETHICDAGEALGQWWYDGSEVGFYMLARSASEIHEADA